MLTLIITLALVGFILYLVETYIPMSPPFKLIIRVVVAIALIYWLLSGLGISGLPPLHLR